MKTSVAALKKFFGQYLTAADAVGLHAVLTAAKPGDVKSVRETMFAIDRLIGGHGTEVVRGRHVDNYYGDIVAEYVNVGDTYAATVLFDTIKKAFRLTTLGDWLEKCPKSYELERADWGYEFSVRSSR